MGGIRRTPLVILTVGALCILVGGAYLLQVHQRRALLIEEADERARVAIVLLRDQLKESEKLLSGLVLQDAVKQVFEDPASPYSDDLLRILGTEAQYNPIDQIRLIGPDGRERLRTNYPGEVVAREALQDKSHRLYFREAITLNRGELYISYFNLNIENREIERPYKPTIRLAMPVTGDDGRTLGIGVVNLSLRTILSELKDVYPEAFYSFALLNERGYYLHASDPGMRWGDLLPDRKAFNLGTTDPELWMQVGDRPSGFSGSREGLAVWRKYQVDAGWQNAPPIRARDPGLVFLFRIPDPVIAAMLRELRIIAIGSFLLLATIAIALIYMTYDRRHARRLAAEAFDHASIGMALMSTRGQIQKANRALCELTGLSENELLGRHLRDLTHPDDRARLEKLNSDLFAGRLPTYEHQGRYVRQDGSHVWVRQTVSMIRDNGGNPQYLISQSQNLTEQKTAQRERKLMQSAIEHSDQAIFITDESGDIEYVNPAAAYLSGYAAEELKGNHLGVVNDGITDRAFFREKQASLKPGHWWFSELAMHLKDGTTRAVACTISPIRDSQGSPENFVASYRDLSSQREVEVEKADLEERLRMAQRMESVGRVAAGVAHDFNNMLTVILGYTQLLRSGKPAGDADDADLLQIESAVEKATALTQQLLAFSRRQPHQPRVMQLNRIISDLEPMLGRLLTEEYDVNVELSPDIGPVLVDPAQMEQVIMNMVTNARDAMPDGGSISIRTSCVDITREEAIKDPDRRAGTYTVMEVVDSGSGIPDDIRQKIFEPFFTTKARAKGTGLGLATVYGVIRQSGGHIDIQTSEAGTAFLVYLPVSDAASQESSSDKTPVLSVKSGNWTILVVDDDEAIRSVIGAILSSAGFQPVIAESARRALEMVEAGQVHPDLLLTDLVMPEMRGNELADAVLDVLPDTRILYMSGYPDDMLPPRDVPGATFDYIQKPFTVEQVRSKINYVMGS